MTFLMAVAMYRSVGGPSFLKTYSSAACYVTLTPDECALDCSMLASDVQKVNLNPKCKL